MHSFFKNKIIYALFFICSCCFIFAITVPPLNGAVNDLAGVLSGAEKSEIETFLLDVNRKSRLQIAVLIIKSLENEALEDYSERVASEWKLGSKKHSSGALLLVVINDKKLRIETGYGLEEHLTDARASQIIRNVIAPQFKKRHYGDGVFEGVKAMTAYALQDETLLKTVSKEESDEKSGTPFLVVFLIIYFLISKYARGGFFWLPFLLLSLKSGSRGGFSSGRPFSGGGWSGGSVFSGGGGSFGGGGASGSW